MIFDVVMHSYSQVPFAVGICILVSSYGHSLSIFNLFFTFHCFRTSAFSDFTFGATAVAVVVFLNSFNFMLDLMKLFHAYLYGGILSYPTSLAHSSSSLFLVLPQNGKVFRRSACKRPIYLSYPLCVLLQHVFV